MAEYGSDLPDDIKWDEAPDSTKPTVMLLAIDVRTMYSDNLDVTVSPSGVTLQFNQGVSGSETAPVARVGMSHHQAELVVRTLQQALMQARYGQGKLLPPPSDPTEL